MIRLIPRKVLKGDGSSVSSLNQGQLSQNVLNRHNMEQRLLDKIKAAVIIQQLRKNSAITQEFSNYARIQQLRENSAITQEVSNYSRIKQLRKNLAITQELGNNYCQCATSLTCS
jgi:hypothetical protein